MPDFNSIEDAIKQLSRLADRLDRAAAVGLAVGSRIILTEVQHEVGHYQLEDTGPAPPFAELTQATQDSRVRQNYSENDPGDRDGTMAASYGARALGLHAKVGSDDPHAVLFETGVASPSGTSFHQAPRMVLTVAAYRKAAAVARSVGSAVLEELRKGR